MTGQRHDRSAHDEAGGMGSDRIAPIFLTVAETAAILRTTPKAVYALIERAQLAGVVRLGRRVLVKRDVLLRDLDER